MAQPADELYDAAWRDDVARIDELLNAGTPVDAVSEHGLPALHAAIENSSERAVERLLYRGASVNRYAGTDNWSPLSHAVEDAVLCATDNVTDKLPTHLIQVLCERGASPEVSAKPLKCSPFKYAELLAAQTITRDIGLQLLAIFRQTGARAK